MLNCRPVPLVALRVPVWNVTVPVAWPPLTLSRAALLVWLTLPL